MVEKLLASYKAIDCTTIISVETIFGATYRQTDLRVGAIATKTTKQQQQLLLTTTSSTTTPPTGLSENPSLVEGGKTEERKAVCDAEGHVTDGEVHYEHVGRGPQGFLSASVLVEYVLRVQDHVTLWGSQLNC